MFLTSILPERQRFFVVTKKLHLNKFFREAIMKRSRLKNKTSKRVFICEKNIPVKWEPQLNEISPYKIILLKNQNQFT